MKKKLKVYVITLSRVFPVSHPKAGLKTYFKTKLENTHVVPFDPNGDSVPDGQPQLKRHTIRANYELWRKRFEQIERGEACLSIRQWTGKPYASKQIEIARLTKDDGIGLQRLRFTPDRDGQFVWWNFSIDGHFSNEEFLANNDGLTLRDWCAWFKDYDLSKPLAIIQFTKFRY